MDIEPPNVYQVLSNLQKKIAFLFQDLMQEKSSYKQNSENLNIKLEQLSAEAKVIKKENEALREIYNEVRSIIYAGVRLFRNADFSGVKREHEIELENLKKIFFDTDRKLKSFESSHISGKVGLKNSMEYMGKSSEVSMSRYAINEAEIQKEFESLKELNFTTQCFDDNEGDGRRPGKEYALNNSNGESIFKNLYERKPQNQYQVKNAVGGNESSYPGSIDFSNSTAVQPSPVESLGNKSPVFKDFGNHRQDATLAKEIDILNSSSSPLKLANENFMDKPKNFITSPWKMSSHAHKNSPAKGSSTPKLARRKLDIVSPKRSPSAHLKKSNAKEAEISISGVRKLTQTVLNIECYKKKGLEDWKSCENSENRNFGVMDDFIECETKLTMDMEEDDFITESPKSRDQLTEGITSRNRNENVLREVHLITPPETSGASDADPDETYISSSVIRKCKLAKRHVLENASEEQKPLKKPAREKSPEYDSVPFIYKRDPIRKKAERMKLPGHACLECNKYYENALGDVDTPNLKKILNKCSRHRDRNSPTRDETPPGYWKPYLTCTGMTPPKEDLRDKGDYKSIF